LIFTNERQALAWGSISQCELFKVKRSCC